MIFKLIYIPWMIGILIALYFLFKALRRIVKGIISYRTLGKKEFLERLKKGFDDITPTQRTRGELNGIAISLIGLVTGFIIMLVFRIEHIWYWVSASLLGGSILTTWQLIGKLQQYRILKKQDEIIKSLDLEEKEEKQNE